jgi:hypothetical protein
MDFALEAISDKVLGISLLPLSANDALEKENTFFPFCLYSNTVPSPVVTVKPTVPPPIYILSSSTHK